MPETRSQVRRRIESEMGKKLLDLPPDVLLKILTLLCPNERLRLSLVSKSFQTLIDGFIRTLCFDLIPSASCFRKLFYRFASVTRISLNSAGIIRALTAIANSSLKIESLEIHKKPGCLPSQEKMTGLSSRFGSVKSLKLHWFGNLDGLPAAEFVHMFKSLEELDLSGFALNTTWNDVEIAKLAPKVQNLRKITMDYSIDLTDRSLEALLNCVNLEHISIDDCRQITIQGFCEFLRKKKNLKSVVVPVHFQDIWLRIPIPEGDVLTLAEAISCCENLCHLSIINGLVTDAFLRVVANSHPTLTSLVYSQYTAPHDGYTMTGLSAILRASQWLTKLHIALPFSLLDTQDVEISQLVEPLVCLKDVTLVSHTTVYATLFSMLHNCPSLECINVYYTLGTNTHSDLSVPQSVRKNYNIQHIGIYPGANPVFQTAVTGLGKKSP